VEADTTPAIITVAGNADLHRERQPAIKVHGFHGESRRLFLSLPVTFFFVTGFFPAPYGEPVSLPLRSPFLFLFIPNTESLVSRPCPVNATWNQLTTAASRPFSSPGEEQSHEAIILSISRRELLESPRDFLNLPLRRKFSSD